MKRRAVVVTGIVLVALASGCGGGSDGTGIRPAAKSDSQGSAATAMPQASDGQLGGAVVARPGTLTTRGHVEKITGKSVLPPSKRSALAAEDNCQNQDLQPTAQNLQTVSDAVFCLMNALRADNGVPALKQQDQLAQASLGHSQDMVQNKYFAHDSQDGRDVVARLKQVSYIPKSGDWVIGENLAWGSGTLATPKALVNAWMNSPEHRDNLLSGDFQEVGMGVSFGTPSQDAPDGVTVTTDFGTRSGGGVTTSSAGSPGPTDTSGTDTSGTDVTGGSGNVAGVHSASVRRKKALRRCSRRHGHAKRRCVSAARRIH